MNKDGFTLTELMIVVIIISGLMFLIVPNIISMKDNIDTKTCDAYIELVNSQIQAYIIDKDIPPADIDTLVTENYIKSTSCPNGDNLTIINNKAEIVITP